MSQKKEVGSQLLNGQAQKSAQMLVVCMGVLFFSFLSFVVSFFNLEDSLLSFLPSPPMGRSYIDDWKSSSLIKKLAALTLDTLGERSLGAGIWNGGSGAIVTAA